MKKQPAYKAKGALLDRICASLREVIPDKEITHDNAPAALEMVIGELKLKSADVELLRKVGKRFL